MEEHLRKKNFTRYTAFFICMIIVFSAILSRLIYLQIVKGEDFREQVNNRAHRTITTIAPRGKIYDRNGDVLATNRQSFSLIFTETSESKKKFFDTMNKVFKILDENGEKQKDDFGLKINPFRFEFISPSWQEPRFKKDRGFDYDIRRQLFEGKKNEELTKEEKKRVEEELAKITAEEAFYKLINQYKLYDLIKDNYEEKEWKNKKSQEKINLLLESYDLETIRRYMVVKDEIKMNSFSGYKPVVIANDLKQKTAFKFEQIQASFPGISIINQPIREYPYEDLASSIIGYISKINSSNKEKYEEKGYDISADYIGAAGIERVYENILRGVKGQESIEVNKYGRKIKTLGELEPYPGKSLALTIDKDIQIAAEKALDKVMQEAQELGNKTRDGRDDDVDKTNATRGAAVVLDINSGEVLALASRPGYDPNLFAVPGRLSDEDYKKYFMPDLEKFGREYIQKRGLAKVDKYKDKDISHMTEEEKVEYILNDIFPLDERIKNNTTIREDIYDIYPKPFYNYATQSLMPPGSIFKPLTTIAGLEEGVIDEKTRIVDRGYYNKRYKDYKGASWMFNLYGYGHGTQNVVEALRDSNNYFFYEVADRLFEKGGLGKEALDMIAKYAWKFGLGLDPKGNEKASTGIEIDEFFGQVYNYEYGKKMLSRLYMMNLNGYLSRGEASIWVGVYKGIDIVPTDEDSNEVNKVKIKIRDAVLNEMRSEEISDSTKFNALMKELLNDLINIQPEIKGKYSENDVECMIKAVNSSIRDARTNIIRGINLYDASIGQGLNQFTPLQLANYIATVVNGGNRYKVHLVDKILDPDGKVEEEYGKDPVILDKVNISDKTVDIVKRGMLEVTTNPSGTAYRIFKKFPIKNGGKTGSATFNDNFQEDIGRTSYATYIGFAPYENPEIAVCAVVFDGGHGSYAAPVAKAVYEEYFKEEILKINPDYEFMFTKADEKNNQSKMPKED